MVSVSLPCSGGNCVILCTMVAMPLLQPLPTTDADVTMGVKEVGAGVVALFLRDTDEIRESLLPPPIWVAMDVFIVRSPLSPGTAM